MRTTSRRSWTRSVVFIALLTAVWASSAAAQKTFEGTITYTIDMGDRQMQLAISARGDKVRQEMTMTGTPIFSEGTYQIFDNRTGDVTTVVPGMKRFMVANVKALREQDSQTAAARDSAREKAWSNLVSSGRSERIVGIACDVYVFKDNPDDEVCVTSALGHFRAFEGESGISSRAGGSVGGNPALSRLMRTFKEGAVVLRVRRSGPDGRDISMVATKLDRTRRPSADFGIPAGFEEMQNPIAPRP